MVQNPDYATEGLERTTAAGGQGGVYLQFIHLYISSIVIFDWTPSKSWQLRSVRHSCSWFLRYWLTSSQLQTTTNLHHTMKSFPHRWTTSFLNVYTAQQSILESTVAVVRIQSTNWLWQDAENRCNRGMLINQARKFWSNWSHICRADGILRIKSLT